MCYIKFNKTNGRFIKNRENKMKIQLRIIVDIDHPESGIMTREEFMDEVETAIGDYLDNDFVISGMEGIGISKVPE